MKSIVLSTVTLLALLIVGGAASAANAQGFHFGGGRVHVDIGNPHGGYGYYGHYPHSSYYGGHGGGYGGYSGWGGADWHDTTHLDYHPGEFVPHRNHYHYVPGHYDVHHDGHWDHF